MKELLIASANSVHWTVTITNDKIEFKLDRGCIVEHFGCTIFDGEFIVLMTGIINKMILTYGDMKKIREFYETEIA